jgi:hypothetical protein
MSLLLAAAAAAQSPVAVSADPDVHSLAAYLFVAGNAADDKTASADDKAGIQSIVMYFFGKLDGARPGRDLRTEVMQLVQSPSYGDSVLKSDVERCSKEAMTRGQYLETFGDDQPAAPSHP